MPRYRLDPTVRRFGTTVLGGSPLRLFRLTPAGAAVVDRLEAGAGVEVTSLIDRLLDAGAIHPIVTESTRFGLDDVTVVTPVHQPGGRAPEPPPGGIRRVVVDDGSHPPVDGADVVLPRNRGPGAARNRGLEEVETPIVAFVDDDVELPDGWWRPLLAHFDDDRIAWVAPRVRSRPGPSLLERYERASSPLDLGDAPARIRTGTRVSYTPTAVALCHVGAVRQVGGFDPHLRFGEDVDLVWRLDAAGWRCRYEPVVEVEHRPRSSWAELVRQRIGYGSSAGPLALRHPRALSPVRTNGWTLTSWALLAGGHVVAAGALAAGSAAALVPRLPDLPASESIRIATLGTWHGGRTLADAVRRAWWPVLVAVAPWSHLARRALVLSALAAGDPRRIVDDVAASIGTWRGAWRARTLDPLLPRLDPWPPRRSRRAAAQARTAGGRSGRYPLRR